LARKKRGWKRFTKFSLGDLQRMVEVKLAEIEKLRARRESTAAQLGALDAEIRAAGGTVTGSELGERGASPRRSAAGPSSKRRGRRKGAEKGRRRSRAGEKGQSVLHNAIRAALKSSKEPVKLSEIAVAVRKGGYRTKSANFGVILGQRIPEMKDVRRVERGVYAMR